MDFSKTARTGMFAHIRFRGGESSLTKCIKYWEIVLKFKKRNNFKGFCKWCGNEATSQLYDDWKAVDLAVEFMKEFSLEKLPITAIRPLIREKNKDIKEEAISRLKIALRQKGAKFNAKLTQKIISGLKRQKSVEAFILGEKGDVPVKMKEVYVGMEQDYDDFEISEPKIEYVPRPDNDAIKVPVEMVTYTMQFRCPYCRKPIRAYAEDGHLIAETTFPLQAPT